VNVEVGTTPLEIPLNDESSSTTRPSSISGTGWWWSRRSPGSPG
jgi:hypothetical protein